ncbi:hypothetical protein K1T71_004805 [Dendrolimus kikuchii]|uniref:Uncharacterized protein n=1 Tax=Dendrolimus kikuchii TaxID=765133 RepID=A0ACC1D587_9NEOP|nr:hypothetical protein K1T71_004805 [Dendrolimus kikuchii]
MGLKTTNIVATLTLNLLQYAYAEHILSCNATSYGTCKGHNQFCNQTTSECECNKGYVRLGDDCEPPGADTATGHGATVALVSIFTVALIVCGLFLVIRKYNLIEYVRQKINTRRNNDVMYEDVMIGNDDPPLSP